jgi:hypothetical protein
VELGPFLGERMYCREPTLPPPYDDESVTPNPGAQLVSGGWYLPGRTVKERSSPKRQTTHLRPTGA